MTAEHASDPTAPEVETVEALAQAFGDSLGWSMQGPELLAAVHEFLASPAMLTLLADTARAAEARVTAELPAECWVSRDEQVVCTDFIGVGFENAVFTREMCCLPCRIRAALRASEADRG